MNKSEIITVLKELNSVTGFRVSLHDADCKEIAAYPKQPLPFCEAVQAISGERERCEKCDADACKRAIESRESVIYKCRYGLTESVSPLYNFGVLTGFLMMGQVAESKEDAEAAAALAKQIIDKTPSELSESIPTVTRSMILSYAKIMEICARYLTLSGAMELGRASVGQRAKKYITEHFKEKLCVSDIASHIGCSKSTLMNAFSREYRTTVNDFIIEKRIVEATKLMNNTHMSLSEIATAVGFADQSYFSKVFSAKRGIAPGKYKKMRKG